MKDRREAEQQIPRPPPPPLGDENGPMRQSQFFPNDTSTMNPISPSYSEGFIGVEVPLGSHPLEQGDSPDAMSSNNDSNVYIAGMASGEKTAWDRSDNVDRLFGEESDRQRGSDIAAGSSRSVVVEINEATGHGRSTIEEGTHRKGPKGFLARQIDSARNFVAVAVMGPDSWDKVLADGDGWNPCGNFKRYYESMDRLDKASNGEGREKVPEIAREVGQHLGRGKFTMLHLAFAARVYDKSDLDKLATLVIVRLHRTFENIDADKIQKMIHCCGRFDRSQLKPDDILHAFFQRVLESWNSLQVPLSSDAALSCIFGCWMILVCLIARTSIGKRSVK
jgi:hypothetical protein